MARENAYAAFCPQLNIIVRGTSHEEVESLIRKKIQEALEKRKIQEEEFKKISHYYPSDTLDYLKEKS